MVKEEKLYQIALSLVAGIGSSTFYKLVEQFSSAQGVFETPLERLRRCSFLTTAALKGLQDKSLLLAQAEALINYHQSAGIQVITCLEEAYPYRLKEIADPPLLLFCEGNIYANAARMIGIVGTRNNTLYGQQVVEELIRDLVPYEPVIVSGLAYGIDILSHQQALKHSLPTLAVLPSGLRKIYPETYQPIAKEIIKQGGLISEYTATTAPERHQFVARNRIIAGLVDVLIVVEAGEKSGALITASLANMYNREVMAVPNHIYASSSKGCNYLIQNNQASLITSVSDIAHLMNWNTKKENETTSSHHRLEKINQMNPAHQDLVKCILAFEKEADVDFMQFMSYHTQKPAAELLTLLLELELQDLIQPAPGGGYVFIG